MNEKRDMKDKELRFDVSISVGMQSVLECPRSSTGATKGVWKVEGQDKSQFKMSRESLLIYAPERECG